MPSVGHNSSTVEMTEDHERALLYDWAGKIISHRSKMAALKGEIANFYKGAKAEIGIDSKEINDAIEMMSDEDGSKFKEKMERRLKIARLVNHPIGTQFNLFQEPDRRPGEEKAEADGYEAGLRAASRVPPGDPVGPIAQAWLSGYERGQDVLKEAFIRRSAASLVKGDQPGADGAKPRRGRKPKLTVVGGRPPSTEDDDMATPGGAEVDADGIPTAEAAVPIEEPAPAAVAEVKTETPKPTEPDTTPIAGGGASFDEAAPTFLDRRKKKAEAAAAAAVETKPIEPQPAPAVADEEDPDL